MAVALGLLVAAAFGSGDFLGGHASRRADTVAVLLGAQAVALLGAVVVALVVSAHVATRDLAFGAGAGLANAAGLGMLYHGLAHGRAGVVAPVTAIVAAVGPAGWGLANGERPSAVVLAGAALALVAAGLISREQGATDADANTSGLGFALLAGVGFGTSFVLFAETSERSGMWPVLLARASALVIVGAAVGAVLATGRRVHAPRGGDGLATAAAGVLDVTATVALLVAVREGMIVVVAPLAALACAFTVLLAFVVGREALVRHQVAGLALGLLGLVLIAAGRQ
jgi:drug/metabolite transporter (DMT)-like permease